MSLQTVIDGYALSVQPEQWRLDPIERRSVDRVVGGARELIARTPAGHPRLDRRYRFACRWSHLGQSADRVRELLWIPGPHRLILWRTEYLQWQGDGARTTWSLPRGWACAVTGLDPVPAHAIGQVPELRIGYEGAPLTVSFVDGATFDTSTPPAGTAWVRDALPDDDSADGQAIQLGDVVPVGETLFGRVVPSFRVLRADGATGGQTLVDVVTNPLDLALEESV